MSDDLNQKTELCYGGPGDPHWAFKLYQPFLVILTSFPLKCYHGKRLGGRP